MKKDNGSKVSELTLEQREAQLAALKFEERKTRGEACMKAVNAVLEQHKCTLTASVQIVNNKVTSNVTVNVQ